MIFRDHRCNRAHVDHQSPLATRIGDTLMKEHVGYDRAVLEHEYDHLSLAYGVSRRFANPRARTYQVSHLADRSVPDGDLVALFYNIHRHRLTHQTDAEKTDWNGGM